MLYNYLKIALRHLTRNTVYSFINIGGLAVGIACSLLILLWVADEYSYDRFHRNDSRLYKLYQSQQWADGIGTGNSMPYPLRETILSETSQIDKVVMTNWGEGNMLQVGDKRMYKYGLSVSADFLKMFSFPLVKGDSATALDDMNSIVITEKTAKALFGERDPLNQFVRVDNDREVKVTGVLRNIPAQSFFQFDYFLPFSLYESVHPWVKYSQDAWDNNSFQMYVLLQPGANEESVNSSIEHILGDNNPKAPTAKLFLHPISKWRLFSNFENGVNTGGLIEYVRLFTVIAIFILVIACINFMNLATARSEGRAREVGIRKSVGSRRKELISQFLGESILVTFISFAFAIVLVEVSLPLFNQLVSKSVSIPYSNPLMWAVALTLILVLGIFSGSYPAFYLSSFQAVKVLKGKFAAGKGATTPRQILVVLQFGFSIFLIIGTFIIYQQIVHVKNREVGYNRENLIQIWTNSEAEGNFQTLREALVQTGAVSSVCKSNSPITAIFSNNNVSWAGMPDQRVSFSTIATEYDYTRTMGIKLIEGRDFSPEFKSDTMAVLVNEVAVNLMGFKDPIGQTFMRNAHVQKIIGVISDVVMDSPYQPVEPMMVVFDPEWSSTISIRLNETPDLTGAIAKVEGVFKKFNPNYPFQYRFVDDDFNKKFSNINLVSRLATIFAALAIVISCLGLLGLAAFTAQQRIKEIGIRKVLGASVGSIVVLITKDFSRLVLVAFAIAAPAGWWSLSKFLERYPYRVDISMWVLVSAGLAALILAVVIVSTQALRAAVTNPVNSLRSE